MIFVCSFVPHFNMIKVFKLLFMVFQSLQFGSSIELRYSCRRGLGQLAKIVSPFHYTQTRVCNLNYHLQNNFF